MDSLCRQWQFTAAHARKNAYCSALGCTKCADFFVRNANLYTAQVFYQSTWYRGTADG